MALFNGVPIADPSKNNLNFVTKEGFRPVVEGLNSDERSSTDKNLKSSVIEGVTSSTHIESHYDMALKDDQLPHTTDGDQEKDIAFKRDYESVKGFRVDETVTIPYTAGLREDIEDDLPYEIGRDKKADVEVPLSEAGKRLTDQNGEGYYDPGIKKGTEFAPGEHDMKPIHKYSRPITDSPTMMADPKDFIDENHYKTIYTTNNQWTNPNTGKVHMFEDLRTSDRDDTQLGTI